MDFLYSLLKISSMLATGVFGALALLTKYKDDKGKITRWGRIALGGILISSTISLGLYILETSKAKAAAKAAQAEAEKAEARSNATAKKLESILDTAQTTSKQQEESLKETNVLKVGLEKLKSDLEKTLDQQQINLEKSNYIAKGMDKNLIRTNDVARDVQQSVETGRGILVKQEDVLVNTKRAMHPLGVIGLRIEFTYELTDYPEFAPYVKRVRDYLYRDVKDDKKMKVDWYWGDDDYIAFINIYSGSPLFPSANELDAEMLLNSLWGSLKFGADKPQHLGNNNPPPSLMFNYEASNNEGNDSLFYGPKSGGKSTIILTVEFNNTNKMDDPSTIRVRQMVYTTKIYESMEQLNTLQISSVYDLIDKTMLLTKYNPAKRPPHVDFIEISFGPELGVRDKVWIGDSKVTLSNATLSISKTFSKQNIDR